MAIPDEAFSASSAYVPNVGARYARLNSERGGGAWCPKQQVNEVVHEYIDIDLGSVYVITGIQTQGRYDHGRGLEYMELYFVDYKRSNVENWKRYQKWNGQQLLTANSDTHTTISNRLNPPMFASIVRISPFSNYVRTVCLRLEFRGCLYQNDIINYQLPYDPNWDIWNDMGDISYDGERSGDFLINGLGRLVDGTYGGDSYSFDVGLGKGSAWVSWKNETFKKQFVEIIFQFGHVHRFKTMNLYCNNNFSKRVQVFSILVAMFSIGGKYYNGQYISYSHSADTTFESARNVTVGLNNNVGKFVKIQMYFSDELIMISETSFDSVIAEGNFTVETESIPDRSIFKQYGGIVDPPWDPPQPVSSDSPFVKATSTNYFIITICLLTILLLVLGVISGFFVITNCRKKKIRQTNARKRNTVNTMVTTTLQTGNPYVSKTKTYICNRPVTAPQTRLPPRFAIPSPPIPPQSQPTIPSQMKFPLPMDSAVQVYFYRAPNRSPDDEHVFLNPKYVHMAETIAEEDEMQEEETHSNENETSGRFEGVLREDKRTSVTMDYQETTSTQREPVKMVDVLSTVTSGESDRELPLKPRRPIRKNLTPVLRQSIATLPPPKNGSYYTSSETYRSNVISIVQRTVKTEQIPDISIDHYRNRPSEIVFPAIATPNTVRKNNIDQDLQRQLPAIRSSGLTVKSHSTPNLCAVTTKENESDASNSDKISTTPKETSSVPSPTNSLISSQNRPSILPIAVEISPAASSVAEKFPSNAEHVATTDILTIPPATEKYSTRSIPKEKISTFPASEEGSVTSSTKAELLTPIPKENSTRPIASTSTTPEPSLSPSTPPVESSASPMSESSSTPSSKREKTSWLSSLRRSSSSASEHLSTPTVKRAVSFITKPVFGASRVQTALEYAMSSSSSSRQQPELPTHSETSDKRSAETSVLRNLFKLPKSSSKKKTESVNFASPSKSKIKFRSVSRKFKVPLLSGLWKSSSNSRDQHQLESKTFNNIQLPSGSYLPSQQTQPIPLCCQAENTLTPLTPEHPLCIQSNSLPQYATLLDNTTNNINRQFPSRNSAAGQKIKLSSGNVQRSSHIQTSLDSAKNPQCPLQTDQYTQCSPRCRCLLSQCHRQTEIKNSNECHRQTEIKNSNALDRLHSSPRKRTADHPHMPHAPIQSAFQPMTWNIIKMPGMFVRFRDTDVVTISRENLMVKKKIGSSYMGDVFFCKTDGIHLTDSGRVLARTQKSDSLSEMKCLMSLQDSNIAKFLGVCTVENLPWLIIDCNAEFGDLPNFLKTNKLSFGSLMYMGTQIAAAMRYLESRNLIHKDLAARNCFINRGYMIKLTDIAISNDTYRDQYISYNGVPAVPLRWLPWESITLNRYENSAWSFAVTLWEVLTLNKEIPYARLSNEQLIIQAQKVCIDDKHGVYHLPRPSVCPSDVYDMMTQCWEVDPSERPTFRQIYSFMKRYNSTYTINVDEIYSRQNREFLFEDEPEIPAELPKKLQKQRQQQSQQLEQRQLKRQTKKQKKKQVVEQKLRELPPSPAP